MSPRPARWPSTGSPGRCPRSLKPAALVLGLLASFDALAGRPAAGQAPPVPAAPTFGAAAVGAQQYFVGAAVNLQLPAASGGAGAVSYTLTPALPGGLTLDAATRRVTGAPRAAAARRSYTWTATDAGGDSARLSFSIAVAAANAPRPRAVTLITHGDGNYTNGETITVFVSFDRRVTVTGAPQLALAVGGAVRQASTRPGGSTENDVGFRYTVTAADFDGDGVSIGAGALTLNGGSIADAGTGVAAALGLGGYTVTNAAGHTVNDSRPAFPRGAAIADLTLRKDAAASVTLPAAAGGDGSLVYTTVPVLPAGLSIGGANRVLSGTPTAAGRTTHVLKATDADGDSATLGTFAVDVVPAPAVNGVSIVSSPAAGGAYGRSEIVKAVVTFDRAVTPSAAGAITLPLDVGGRTLPAVYNGRTANGGLRFLYALTAAERDTDGISVRSPIALAGGATIRDAATGFDAVLGLGSHAITNAGGHRVDGGVLPGMAPTDVRIVSSPASSDGYDVGERIEVEVTWPRAVLASGSPRLALGIGSDTRQAAYRRRGAAGDSLIFAYAVAAADTDADGVSIGAGALTLNAGTIRDGAGADAALGLGSHAVTNAAAHKVFTPPSVTGFAVTSRPPHAALSGSAPVQDATYTLGQTITVRATFDQAVTVTGSPALTLAVGGAARPAAAAAGSGAARVDFRYTVAAADLDTDGIGIHAGALTLPGGAAIRDADGNDAVLDLSGLTVARFAGARVNGSKNGRWPDFGSAAGPELTFQAGVSASAALPAAPVPGSPHTYGVTPALPDGLTLDVRNGRISGAAAAASPRTNYTLTSADDGFGWRGGPSRIDSAALPFTLQVTGARPTVDGVRFLSAPAAGDTYGPGEQIRVAVSFLRQGTGALRVIGAPTLALAVGGQPRTAVHDGVDGAAVRFRYGVQAADRDADGVSVAADALALNGGSIRDAAGADAALSLGVHALGDQASHKVDGGSGATPAVAAVTVTSTPAADGAYKRGETLEVAVRFSRAVAVTGSPRLTLGIASGARTAAWNRAGADPTTHYFRYTVQQGDVDADGLSLGAGALALNGGTIRGGAVDADLGLGAHAFTDDAAHKLDGGMHPAPFVTGVSFASPPARGDTFALGETIRLRVSFDKPVTVTRGTFTFGNPGWPRLTLVIGARTRLLSMTTSSQGAMHAASTTLEFPYTVQADDHDPDGLAVTALNVNRSSIRGGGRDADTSLGSHAAAAAAWKVDARRPRVSGVRITSSPPSSQGGRYAAGDAIDADLTFDLPLETTGAPRLALAVGANTRRMALRAASERTLSFRYTVHGNDSDPDGVGIGANALDLNGGTLRGKDTLAAALTGLGAHALGNQAGHQVDGMLRRPSVTSWRVRPPPTGDTFRRGETIQVEVNFSEAVAMSGSSSQVRLIMTIGDDVSDLSQIRRVAHAARVSGARVIFEYTVQQRDVDATGLTIEFDALEFLGAGALRSLRGVNVAPGLGSSLTNSASHKVDGGSSAAPRISEVVWRTRPRRGDTYAMDETVTFAVVWNKPITVSGTPRAGLRISPIHSNLRPIRQLDGAAGADGRSVQFSYTVRREDVADGIAVHGTGVTLAGSATIRGAGGVDASLTFGSAPVEDGSGYNLNGACGPTPAFSTGARIAAQRWRTGASVSARLPTPRYYCGVGATLGALPDTLLFSVTPDLPDGLSFQPASLRITGVPAAVSPAATYTYRMTDTVVNGSASLDFTIEVTPNNLPTFGGATVAPQAWTRNSPIPPLTLPAASGGDGALRYTLSGPGASNALALPDGVAFSQPSGAASGGSLGGTPTVAAARARYTLTAADVDGDEATLGFDVQVADDAMPRFTQAVPNQSWTRHRAITAFTLPSATGGNGALTYVLSPAWPAGVSRDAAHRVSGTPSVATPATSYTWTATDEDGDSAELVVSAAVEDAPTFGSATVPNQSWTRHRAITAFTLPSATGGDGALTYTLSPALPSGVSRDGRHQVSGTPAAALPAATYTWTATDENGDAARLTFSIAVEDAPTFGSAAVSDQTWTRNQAITAFTLPTASDGDGALTYSVSPDWPGGVTKDASHEVSGTPDAALDETTYTWTATDENGDAADLTFTVTVNEETPTVTLSVAEASIAENGGSTTVTATLARSSSLDTTVTVQAAEGFYTVGADAEIVIAAGETTNGSDSVTITAVDDAVDNVDGRSGTVTGAASNSRGAGTVSGAALTLTDDEDTPTVTLALSEPDAAKPDTIDESGTGNASTVTASLSHASSREVTLTVAAAAGTNAVSGDFTLSGAALTIAAGETASTGTVTITAVDDALDSADKEVTVSATVGGSSGAADPSSVTLTIEDDDEAPAVSIGSAGVSEGDSGSVDLTFTVSLSAASGRQVTVGYADAGTGTATSGTDYTALSGGTLTFAAGDTSKTVTVSVTGDTTDEPDETVLVALSSPMNATVSSTAGTGTGTITDDDDAPTVTLALSRTSIAESGTTNAATVTASLDRPSSAATTVTVSAAAGTNAVAGDFSLSSNKTLTIAAGETSSTGVVTVTAVDNTADEPDKSVTVSGSATNAQGITQPSAVTLTITDDDDEPTLSIDSPTVTEGDSGSTNLTFTVTLSSASGRQVTVGYADAGTGTATSGTDYTALSAGTLTFAAGDTSKTVTVSVTGDTEDEPHETVLVALSSPTSAAVSATAGTGTGTITDDDNEPTVTLALSRTSIAESGATNSATVTASLDRASSAATTVTVSAAAGTNAVAGDFSLSGNKTLTIAAGETSSTGAVTVTAVDNTADEPNKSVTVSGSATNTQGITQPAAVTLTITDDDDEPTLSIDSPTVTEGDSGSTNLTFTVTLSSASGRQVTVGYADAGTGTATSGTDYTAVTAGTLTFAAGDTSRTVTVSVTGDTTDEPDETVLVALSSPMDATVSSTAGTGTGTITDDDDAPTVTLALSRTSIAESGATNSATVTASLDRPSSAATTVTVSAAAGTNAVAGDFSLSGNKTLTIAAGETSSTGAVTVTAVDNTADEPNKSVTVSGSATNTQGITQPSAVTLTITDDDDAPTLSIDSPTVTEGDSGSTNLTFTVTLSPASGRQVTVRYADAGTGTATSGTDYTALTAGTLTFAAGDTSKTVTVSVTGDTEDEPHETVKLTLSSPTSAAVSATAGTGTGTITDDDDAPTVTLALSRTSIAESGATNSATVTASLDRPSSAATTVTVSAAAGTNAVSGDFSLSGNKTLTIAAGETSSTGAVTVTAVDNTADEPNKSVTVSGSAANSQGITQPSAVTLTITDDDDEPTLSIDSPSVSEGDSGSVNLTFTVTLSPVSGRQVTVGYADAGTGTATSGTDYTALSGGTLTFAAGDTSKTVTVSVTGDTEDEPNETVKLTLSSPTSAAVSATAGTGTGTITDDDDAPTVTLALSRTSIAESGATNSATVTASLDRPSSAATTVTVSAAAGTNAVAGDFSLSGNKTLTIAAGETSSTGAVTVTAVDNTADEPNKSVTVSGSATNTQGITQPSAVTLTITDDDNEPTLSIDSPTVTEGDSGSVSLTFTVTLSPASGRQVTVGYADAGTGTATSGTDYTALTAGTLTFAAGETSKTVTVSVTGDTEDEPNETVLVALSSPTSAAVSATAGTGTGTITDDDAAPTVTLALSRTSIAESGATNSTTVTASLDHASSAATTVTVSAAAGTNAVSGDFSLSSNKTLTIVAGETSSTGVVTVTAVDNTADEPNKSVTVSGSATNTQGITQPAAVTLTITDDDDAPTLSIDSPSISEGDSGSANLTFTVTLSPASGRQVTVNYADAGTGTATSGTDYTALSGGTLTFAAGDTSKTVTVSVTGDTEDEPNETVVVALSSPTNATVSATAGTGTGRITDDDDAPTVTLALSRTSIAESGATNSATVTASLDRASSAATTITVSAAAGTNAVAGDFSLSSNKTLTVAAGETSSTGAVTVTAVDNTADEPDKSVTVSGSATNSQGITQPSAVTLTITDDDNEPTLSIDSPTVTEGDSGSVNLTFTVTLSPASGRQVTVGYADAGTGTATSGTDYTALSGGTLTFAAGDTSKTVTVSVTGDTTDEPNETVIVTLSSPVNAVVSNTAGSGTGTITDDDDAPTVTLALSRTSIAESGATNSATVTASLDRASSAATTVTVSAAAGTNAVAGDFSLSSNKTLTIAAGETSSTGAVTVTAVDNTADEPDKSVTVSGSATNTQGITQPSAVTLTITDDDNEPTLSIDSPTVTEGDSGSANLTFTVTLSPASGRQVTVGYADAGTGTATSGTDYTALSGGTLTFAAGDTSKTVTVSVTGDTEDEPNETVKLTLSSPTSAAVSNTAGTGTGTITDDDDAPTVTLALSRTSIAESGATNSATVTASLDRASSAATTVTVSAAAGTNAVAGDFSLSGNKTLTIAAGETSSTGAVTVTAVDNTADEPDKSVTVSASATNTQGITQPAAVTLTITDDDDEPTLSIDSPTVTEGDSGSTNLTFTVTLSPASGRQVTVRYADAGTGTATSGTDYSALSGGTLTFAAGDTSKTVTVSVTGDTTDEPNERVLVALSSPMNATVSSTAGSGTGTINDDDDAPTVALALSRTSIAESGTTNSATVTASLDRASSAATTVTVSAAAGTNAVAGDFSLSSNKTLTIAAGETSSTGVVTVTAVDNTADEPNKSVTVSGSATNTQGITQPSAVTLTITDDDNEPTLSIDSPTVTEGDSGSANLTFTVTLSPASGRQVTVGYADAGTGTATSGTDYTALSGGTLTFAAGDTSKTVTVSVTGDTEDEPHETVKLTLSSPTSAAVSATAGTGTGTITDDDDAPTVTLALSRTSIAESGATNSATVTASLDRPSSAATTVTVSAAAGTNAVAGDFSLSSNKTLTIAAGETSSTGAVTVTAVDNTADEPNKSVTVSGSATNTQGITQPAAVTLTITDDDDEPTLSIDSPTVTEGDSGSTNLTFTVTLSSASGRQVTVGYADAGTGTATSGTDYTAVTAGTLTFAAGDTSRTVTVSVTGDTTDEPDETVLVALSSPMDATVSSTAGTGTGTITDDDDAPTVTLALSRTSIAESGATNSATVTASLDRPSSAATTVTVSAAAGTNAVAGDFSLSGNKTLTIAAGETSSTGAVTVTAVDNTADEPNKSVTVSGSATNTQGITQPSAVTLTITDDDDAPTLSIDSPTVTEGDSGSTNLTFTVTLSPASGRQVTVRYADAGTGTATSGTDYTALTAGTLTFAAGDTSKTVTVSVTGDTEDEPHETVKLTLSSPTSAAVSATAGTGTGTITDDDDAPTVTLALSRTSIAESGATNSATVTASLDRPSSAATTVTVSAATGTNAVAGDFSLSSNKTLTIAAGETSSTGAVTVTAVDNTADEPNKSVTVSGSATNTQGITQPAAVTLTITDDDDAPTLSIDSPSVSEGDSGSTNLTFTVTLSPASGRQVTVGYADAGTGTATSGTDYTALSGGTLTFAAGETSKTVTVSVTGDTEDEPGETVVVALSSPTSAAVSATAGTGTGTITDDDDAPTLSIDSPSVAEGAAGETATLTFTVTLSPASGRQVTVGYADAGTGTATAGADYSALASGTLTFAAGETTQTIDVSVTGDDQDETNETVKLTLSSPTQATVSSTAGTGTGTINDDDGAPTLSIDSPSVAEGAAGETATLTFTVTLSPASGQEVTVGYADAGTGTATAGEDYTALASGTLTFAAGDTTQTIDVSVTGDDQDETNETVKLTLSGPTNAAVSATAGTGTGTINDDDGAPTLSIDSPSVAEGAAGETATLTFTVTLSPASGQQVTVGYADAGTGTATSGTDYTALTAGTLTFAAGETTRTIDVSVTGDDQDETNETVKLTLSSPTQATVSSTAGTGTGTINDDDGAPTLSIDSPSVAEGAAGETATLTFTVTLSPASGQQVTVGYADAGTGTATAGEDYTALTAGTLTFAAGETTQTIDVSVTGDDQDETNETVELTLSSPTNAAVSGTAGTGTGTITDDDGGAPTLSIDSPSVAEGAAGETSTLTFTVTLSPASSQQVTVDYADAGTGTATAGEDYAALSPGTLTFAAGDTTRTIDVSVTGDDQDEPDETVVVQLSGAAQASIAAGTGTGTITEGASAAAGSESDPEPEVSGPSFGFALVSDRSWIRGEPVEPFDLPRGSGGVEPLVHALEPPLPAGVERRGFRVSGTPSETMKRRVYRWSVRDARGREDARGFRIDVAAPDLQPRFGPGVPDQRYQAESPIEPLTLPEAAGGDGPLRYALSPAPPAGLTLDPATRTLSGTPTAATAATRCTWTVTDADGDTAAVTFLLEVRPDLKPVFEAESPALRYRAGRPVEPRALPAAVGGDPPLRYTLSPAPPEGLRFDAGRRELSGTPAAEQFETSYTLTATDADGDTATLGLTITVVDPPVVVALRVASQPAAGDTYGYGERVAVEVVFSEPVTLTGTPGLTLTVGERRRATAFRSVEGARLVFGYEVVGVDRDDDGVGVAANALTLDGATLVDSMGTAAEPEHERLADQAGHKVDGRPRAVGSLPPLRLVLGGPPARVELAAAFAGAETYAAESSAPAVASAAVAGTAAVVTALADGTAAVTVFGVNDGGAARQRFDVTVVTAASEVEVVSAALAGVGRSVLASTAATVGRRLEERGAGWSQMTLAGQSLPLDGGAAAGAAGRPGRGGGTAAMAPPPLPAPPGAVSDAPLHAARQAAAGRQVAAGASFGAGPVTADDLLMGSTFSLSFGGDEAPPGMEDGGQAAGGARWTAWGAGDVQSFQGETGSGATWTGRPAAAWLGADVERGRLLAGVAVARSSAEAAYTFREGEAGGSGTLAARLLTVQPYGRWMLDERTSLWGVFGAGRGRTALTRSVTAGQENADLGLLLGLAGMRRELGSGGGFDLALRGDAGGVRLAADGGGAVLGGRRAAAWRTRLGVEVTRPFGQGLTVTPFGALGGRYDGGTDLTGAGVELAGGLRMADAAGRLEVETRGRLLALHTAAGHRERGASVTARLTPAGAGRGLQVEVSPRWGAPAAGADALWQEQAFSRTLAGASAAAGGLDARLGYGFGRLAPFAEAGWTAEADRAARRLRLGLRLGQVGEEVEVEASAERNETGGQAPDYRFSIIGYVGFGASPTDDALTQ